MNVFGGGWLGFLYNYSYFRLFFKGCEVASMVNHQLGGHLIESSTSEITVEAEENSQRSDLGVGQSWIGR